MGADPELLFERGSAVKVLGKRSLDKNKLHQDVVTSCLGCLCVQFDLKIEVGTKLACEPPAPRPFCSRDICSAIKNPLGMRGWMTSHVLLRFRTLALVATVAAYNMPFYELTRWYVSESRSM